MPESAGTNAVIAQSGGPTAVINQSLVGCLEGLRSSGAVDHIYGARHAVRGMVDDDYLDLTEIPQDRLERVANTPSSTLGSSRDKPDTEYCERIVESLIKHNICYFFYIGGNDSSDTCRIVKAAADQAGYDLKAFHIPKTIDNDLVENDHCPGFGSAARFVGHAFIGDNLDNRALPGIKINVVMGRHAGFLTAASALAHEYNDDGPHLIYLPERAIDLNQFIDDVDRVYARLGRCQIAVSEGIHDAEGNYISTVMSQLQEADAHGNVQLAGTGALGDGLAARLRADLGEGRGRSLRVRSDTYGYLQRSFYDASDVDRCEARAVGNEAALVALQGADSGSITIERVSSEPYKARYGLVPLEKIAGKTRLMPDEFINDDDRGVTAEFLTYVKPLVGQMARSARLQ